jgi:hypothetical protein
VNRACPSFSSHTRLCAAGLRSVVGAHHRDVEIAVAVRSPRPAGSTRRGCRRCGDG